MKRISMHSIRALIKTAALNKRKGTTKAVPLVFSLPKSGAFQSNRAVARISPLDNTFTLIYNEPDSRSERSETYADKK